MNKKLSIIIPVYNVEKYIRKCICSCLEQSINSDEYEIIVINDGTKDTSIEIIDSMQNDYDNIIIINQQNKGLSSARNTGLRYCQGEYVWFVDSDDYITPNSLEKIFMLIWEKVDVIAISYNMFFEDSNKILTYSPPKLSLYTGKALLNTLRYHVPAQFYIYRRQFLSDNKLTFYEGIYHEDMEFTPRMLYCAKRIQILNYPIYNYLIRANSITTTLNSKKTFDLITVANSLFNYSNEITDELSYNSFNYLISIAINNALNPTSKYTKEVRMAINNEFYNQKHLFNRLKESSLLKNKLEGYLFALFPNRIVEIYNILKIINHNI